MLLYLNGFKCNKHIIPLYGPDKDRFEGDAGVWTPEHSTLTLKVKKVLRELLPQTTGLNVWRVPSSFFGHCKFRNTDDGHHDKKSARMKNNQGRIIERTKNTVFGIAPEVGFRLPDKLSEGDGILGIEGRGAYIKKEQIMNSPQLGSPKFITDSSTFPSTRVVFW